MTNQTILINQTISFSLPKEPDMTNSLTMMTFNARGAGMEKDGVNHWYQRRKLNIQTICIVGHDLRQPRERAV
jgi:hypothetical protein